MKPSRRKGAFEETGVSVPKDYPLVTFVFCREVDLLEQYKDSVRRLVSGGFTMPLSCSVRVWYRALERVGFNVQFGLLLHQRYGGTIGGVR